MWLFTAFALVLLVQLYFYLFVFGKYAWRDNSQGPSDHRGVSVVIAARNEQKNLSENLKAIAGQVYPDFEIIVVDDGSTDNTPEILERFEEEHSSKGRPVHVLTIAPEESRGKKFALARGIEKAEKEIVLVTDADCAPSSARWIERMAGTMSEKREIVLGYGPYSKIKGSFVNKLVRYETLLTAVQYFSYALHGYPYMGVGRNMAYLKFLYDRAGGFARHEHVKSGDDDLFVDEVANARNTAICDHPDTFMFSKPKRRLGDWVRQKRRHLTSASHYRKSQQARLTLFYLSQIGFYILGIGLAFSGSHNLLLGLLITLRFASFYLALWPSAKKLDEKDLFPLAPLYEISVIFMQLYVFVFNKLSPPKHW